MKLTIEREKLLFPLQIVAGVVEKRQTFPQLANVLLDLSGNELLLVGTDLEVELQGRVILEEGEGIEDGATTVSARKLIDICKALPEHSTLEIKHEDSKLTIRSGRSRFNLATLPAQEFPQAETICAETEFTIEQSVLRTLINKTQFAIPQNDVRYYLNGIFWELKNYRLCAVASDGHRLAYSTTAIDVNGNAQFIVPRKGVLELTRLLIEDQEKVDVIVNNSHMRVKTNAFTFTTKLIDGRYPDHNLLIPKSGGRVLVADRDLLRQAINRVAVLTTDKYQSVCLEFKQNLLRVLTHNPEQEEAEEEINVDYQDEALELMYNANYLQDALGALPAGMAKISLIDGSNGLKIEAENGGSELYIVMPMQI